MFKSKALELGEKLLPAFNTPTGIPRGVINLGRQDTSPYNVVLFLNVGRRPGFKQEQQQFLRGAPL